MPQQNSKIESLIQWSKITNIENIFIKNIKDTSWRTLNAIQKQTNQKELSQHK